MKPLRLIYGYDALCGWCYGIIPALRTFGDAHPDIRIDVVPGGLFTGDCARSYNELVPHITSAFPRVMAATGQSPDPRFWEMIKRPDAPLANSTVPNMAVAWMSDNAPGQVVEFAHRLQEIHFTEGADFNLAQTYDRLSERHGFPKLDTDAILSATEATPLIAAAYAKASALGIRSYPTVLIADSETRVLANLPSVYDPAEFERATLAAIDQVRTRQEAAK